MEIASLREFELIARLTANITPRSDVVQGCGDDCAILDIQSDVLLLVTCDSQVEGVHFSLQGIAPEHIGRKALAVNLSDIAAMGGEPRYALISLVLPSHFPVAVLDNVYKGLRSEAEQYGVTIVGGNISSSGQAEPFVIDITVLGVVERGHALSRQGAQVGDAICVTGTLGDAAAGLYMLQHALSCQPHVHDFVYARHCTPEPRVYAGRELSRQGPAIVTALLDVSDGLSGDLEHLCKSSQVGARIQLAQLPLSEPLRIIAEQAGRDPVHWALHGGEDYELLFTVAHGYEQEVITALQRVALTPVTVIGSICEQAKGIHVVHPDGHEEPLVAQSWDHLRR